MISGKASVVAAAALSVFVGGSAAHADVTAEQVWADWRDYMAAAGYSLDATEERSGDTLMVSDMTMAFDIPEEDASFTMTMGEISFTDNGDGTVSVSVPSDMPIDVMVSGPEGENADIGLNYATEDLSIIVSGDPDDLTYTYSAAMVGLSLERLDVEGEDVDMAELGTAEMTIADLSGTTRMEVGNLRKSTQKATTGAVSYAADFKEPDGGTGSFVLRGGADSMNFEGSASMPPKLDTSDMAAMLKEGFAFDGIFTAEGGSTDFNFQDEEETVQWQSESSSGNLRVAMDEGRLAYAGDVVDVQMSMTGSDIPFPVEIAMEKSGFNIEMPVSEGEEQQDFALGMTLGGFTMSDMIWSIFDPEGQLPHDPATVAIDLSGTAKLFFDLLDPAQVEKVEAGETMPGEINSLDLNALTVSVAGAELTGDGAFTFDNTDLSTFDGVPAPTGEVNLMLVGGNALLDKLVEIGFVPEEEASGMRMMMGLFAVPGDGEDTLTSQIEVKGDGQVLANGQRIQ